MGTLNVNKVQLGGRLVKTPALSQTKGTQVAVCNMLLAVNGKQSVEFIEASAYRALAEQVVAGCQKGTEIFIEGRLRYYKDVGKLKVIADSIQFIGKMKDKPEEDGQAEQERTTE